MPISGYNQEYYLLTTIKNTNSLATYPFRVIAPEVVSLMEATARTLSKSFIVALRLFECYCDLLGVQVSYVGLSSPSYTGLVRGFLGALKSTSFVGNEWAARRAKIRMFTAMHNAMRASVPALEHIGYDDESWAENDRAWEQTRDKFNAERLRYWNGWRIESSKETEHFLDFPCLWESHGKEFTEGFYQHWEMFYRKQARPGYTDLNKMARFLSANAKDWPAATFQHPQKINEFFLAFMKDFFITAYNDKKDLNSQILTWGQLISNCEALFIDTGVWATPYRGHLPKPKSRTTFGAGTHKTIRDNGVIIHEKLITPVPLFLTDEEAIELLFKRIDTDISITTNWAVAQTTALIKAAQSRKEMAKLGTPLEGGSSLKSIAEIGYANICATFERDGFRTGKAYLDARFGGGNRAETAEILGLPTSEKLYPYQILLVSEHPEITGSFLEKLILCDDNGDYIGFVKTETGANLVGYKDRRGKKLSEQVISLNSLSQRWVEEIIEITEPLRNFLREQGDPAWKELFLTCGGAFSKPSSARFPRWNRSKLAGSDSLLAGLQSQFAPYEHLMGCRIQDYLERVSLTSLRASCGVAVYLKTKNVTEMAKALGHARYDSLLLGRYLPEALLGFFQTRWIRIFQRGFICEAMKNSPYLLEATNFTNMDELHSFLKNHALKDIPAYLQTPEQENITATVATKDHVYISIDVGIMTALLSLEQAVNQSPMPNKISGRAKYWAQISSLITFEIERGNDGLLKEHLSTALAHRNPAYMEEVIYESAA